MFHTDIPVLGFAASSGTGKTTLLTKLIPLLRQDGLRVGIIKHSHHDFQIDQPGKDSFRLRDAGASPVMLVSSYRRVVINEFSPAVEPHLQEQLVYFEYDTVDLILVEGFKDEVFPKIELHRSVIQQPLLYPQDCAIIAVASDSPLVIPANLTLLDINNPMAIAKFIQHYIRKIK